MTLIILYMTFQIIQVTIKKRVIPKVGVDVYIHNSLNFKTRPDLSTNWGDIESLALESISEKALNTTVSVLYRRPNGHFEHFQNFLANIF